MIPCRQDRSYYPDSIDFTLTKSQLDSIFAGKTHEEFHIEINGINYHFQKRDEDVDGQMYELECDGEDNTENQDLGDLLQGDTITICFGNYKFFQDVASALNITELLELCQGYEKRYIRNSLKSRLMKFIWNLYGFVVKCGIFGRILVSLWDIGGLAFVIGFYINVLTLFTTMSLFTVTDYPAAFFLVLIPFFFYSFYFTNLVNMTVCEVFSFRIYKERTILSKLQSLISHFIRVLPAGRDYKKKHLFMMGKWYDFLMGIIFLFFSISFLCIFMTTKGDDVVDIILRFFCVILPIFRYGTMYIMYCLHSFASIVPYCRNRFIQLNDFEDPFLDSMYFGERPWHNLIVFIIQQRSSRVTHDDQDGDVLENEEIEEHKPVSVKVTVVKAILSKTTFTVFFIFAIFVYMGVAEEPMGAKQVCAVIFILIILMLPICTRVSLPFFWIRRIKDPKMTENQIRKEKDHEKWLKDATIWSIKFQTLRVSSVIFNSLIFLLMLVIIIIIGFIGLQFDPAKEATGKLLLNTDYKEDVIHNKLNTNPVCYAQPKGLSISKIAALAQASYCHHRSSCFDNLFNEFFGPAWRNDIEIVTTPFPLSDFECYLEHFRIPRLNLSVFSIRGTAGNQDMIADFELWFGSVILNIFWPFIPLLQMFSPVGDIWLGTLINLPRYAFKQFSLVEKYIYYLSGYIMNYKLGPNEDALITGQSLGGGLAKILALKTGYSSVAVSGPGIRSIESFYSDYATVTNTLIDIIPDQDLIAHVDESLGSKFSIPCTFGLSCHPTYRTLCEIAILCGNFENHRSWCSYYYPPDQIEEMIRIGAPINISNI